MKVRVLIGLAVLALIASATMPMAQQGFGCFSSDNRKRIEGCTKLIETPGLRLDQLGSAYAMRALAYSLMGRYATAIKDYDEAIRLVPEFAIALNNRAWAYFKWGRPKIGLPDVERSLRIDPTSAHAYDTRAHIRQWLGKSEAAIRDYDEAMRYGGRQMVRLYQCGLQAQRLYTGPTNGIVNPALKEAIKACVKAKTKCDPLPPDEECKIPVS